MRKTFIGAAALPALGLSVATVVAGLGTAWADPLPYGPDTCINGYAWRNAAMGTACARPQRRGIKSPRRTPTPTPMGIPPERTDCNRVRRVGFGVRPSTATRSA